MTYSICLHIGNATSNDANAFSKILTASSAADVALARSSVAPASLDALLMVVSADDLTKPEVYNPLELANWIAVLTTTASVAIQVVGECHDLQPVHTSFLLAGLASASERRTADGSRILTAKRKPVTAAVPLKKNTPTTNNVVTVSLDDNANDDDMINEDDLLDDTVLAPPPAMGARTAGDDCDGRKPCDDCTCGRAEEQQAEEHHDHDHDHDHSKTAPSSSCGKCHLGDAFRCASCPFLGKPAFKPGEEHLVLDLADDF